MFPSSLIPPSFLSTASLLANQSAQQQQLDFHALLQPLQTPLAAQPSGTSESFLESALRALQLQMLLDQQRQQQLTALQAMRALLAPLVYKEDLEEPKSNLADQKIEVEEAIRTAESADHIERLTSSLTASSRCSVEKQPSECQQSRKRRRERDKERRREKAEADGKPVKEGRKRRRRHEAETDSPVSGMFIKDTCDEEELRQTAAAAEAELDPSAAFVHATDEARHAIAKIPNVIGETRCALCKIKFEDVFRLAMHRCPRIRHEEYRCRECDKVFSCPANLASHRRWHRPRHNEADAAAAKKMKLKDCPEPLPEDVVPMPSESAKAFAEPLEALKGPLDGIASIGQLAEAASALIKLGLVR